MAVTIISLETWDPESRPGICARLRDAPHYVAVELTIPIYFDQPTYTKDDVSDTLDFIASQPGLKKIILGLVSPQMTLPLVWRWAPDGQFAQQIVQAVAGRAHPCQLHVSIWASKEMKLAPALISFLRPAPAAIDSLTVHLTNHYSEAGFGGCFGNGFNSDTWVELGTVVANLPNLRELIMASDAAASSKFAWQLFQRGALVHKDKIQLEQLVVVGSELADLGVILSCPCKHLQVESFNLNWEYATNLTKILGQNTSITRLSVYLNMDKGGLTVLSNFLRQECSLNALVISICPDQRGTMVVEDDVRDLIRKVNPKIKHVQLTSYDQSDGSRAYELQEVLRLKLPRLTHFTARVFRGSKENDPKLLELMDGNTNLEYVDLQDCYDRAFQREVNAFCIRNQTRKAMSALDHSTASPAILTRIFCEFHVLC